MFAGLAAAAVLAGCDATSTTSPSTSAAPPATTGSPSVGTPTSAVAPPPQHTVSEQAAKDLCARVQGQLSNWRVQGPTIGSRPGVNILVREWAFANGGLDLVVKVQQDKTIIDNTMKSACADVHTEAVRTVEAPSLAAVIA